MGYDSLTDDLQDVFDDEGVFETNAGREIIQKTPDQSVKGYLGEQNNNWNGQPFTFTSILEDEGNADLSQYQLGCIPASRGTVRKTEKKLGAKPEEIQQNLQKNQQIDGDI